MPRAARVSGLLDKDFDDSWIVPARPRRSRGPAARSGGTSAPAATVDPEFAPESALALDPVAAPEALSRVVPEPVLAPEPLSRAVSEPAVAPDPAPRRSDHIPGSSAGIPGRRTITIRGQVARPASRRPPRTVRERTGTRPDRIAMWAVLLGILLVLVAATSSHAAMLHAVAGALH